MEFTVPCCRRLLPYINLIVAFLLCGIAAKAQLPVDTAAKSVKEIRVSIISDSIRLKKKDSLKIRLPRFSKDSLHSKVDSIKANYQAGISAQKKRMLASIKGQQKSVLNALKFPKKDSLTDTAKHLGDSSAVRFQKMKRDIRGSITADSTPLRKKDTKLPVDTSTHRFRKMKRDMLTHISKDTLRSITDTIKVNFKAALKVQKKQVLASIKEQRKSLLDALKLPKIDSITVDSINPFKKLFISRPALKLNNGTVCYNANYRSIIDTPYAEKGILQQNITGRWNLTVAGMFPIQVNYWLRQSNSHYFKNIFDVQVVFNGAAFQEKLRAGIRERLLALAPAIKDPGLEKLYMGKLAELMKQENVLKSVFNPQKLIEANETIKVPKLTWDGTLADSVNVHREDSLKKIAKTFLNQYDSTKRKYDQLHKQADSLKDQYEAVKKRTRQYEQLIKGNWSELQSARDWQNKLQEYGLSDINIPAKYRWLLGLRSFSLGRSPVNYSELTAKNISVNGLSLEYNSWYYFALTAGMVNYRFRDFVVSNVNRKPQYLGIVRAGLGRLEKNYFILSALRGQKQLFASSAAVNSTIPITNLSAESRWSINRTSYLTAEVGKSMTPDFRNNPPEGNNALKLSDRNNQALALHLYSDIPLTKSKLEAFYKKTGPNYQSFSSYSTNAAMESWYIKADQNLFKRKLRIAASLRKNEFSNPFIQQDYKSNTIFKSLTATMRVKKWPVVTIGYQPLSQYTKVDNQVIESRFQTFNATLFHFYPVRQLKMSTTIMVSKFYNHNSDTGFLYFNAVNSYFTQAFYFPAFTANAGISYTKNSNYTLQILDGGIQPNIPQFGSIGVGIKINNLNHSEIKAGGYVMANIHLFKHDMLFLSYERGYLPGNKHGLVPSEMGTVQFIKAFNFK